MCFHVTDLHRFILVLAFDTVFDSKLHFPIEKKQVGPSHVFCYMCVLSIALSVSKPCVFTCRVTSVCLCFLCYCFFFYLIDLFYFLVYYYYFLVFIFYFSIFFYLFMFFYFLLFCMFFFLV